MYLVLSLTNGDGYAFPFVKLFHSSGHARREYLQQVETLVMSLDVCSAVHDCQTYEKNNFKSLFVSLDEDEDVVDNFAVRMFPVESGDCIEFCADYVDEVIFKKEKSKTDFDSEFLLEEEEEDGSITFKVYIR